MGLHAFSERAFVLELKELYGLLDQCHVLGIQRSAVRLIEELAGESVDATLALLVSQLRSASSVEEVVDSLEVFVSGVRDAVKDSNLASHGPLQLVFKVICHVVLPVQPEFIGVIEREDVDMGDKPPADTPILWFDFDKCFAIRMTRSGQQLARTLRRKRIYPDEWTTLG
jgi:hypothetical protein